MSNEITHDEAFKRYFNQPDERLSCYLHVIFKGIIVRGEGENRECDVTASRSEQDSRFIRQDNQGNAEIMKWLKWLPSVILSPITLSPMIYIDPKGKVRKVKFTERFEEQARESVKPFLESKYGSQIFDDLLNAINGKRTLDTKELEALIDSARFMVQRSWLSANDISIHSHLRGALMASLNDISLISINNTFSFETKTLKDIEGVYAVKRMFLYHLNSCLLSKLVRVSLEGTLLKKLSSNIRNKYNTPLIDFFTPFIFDADEEKVVLFYVKGREREVEECVKKSFEDTLNEVLGEFVGEAVETVESLVFKLDIKKEEVDMLKDPKILNKFLSDKDSTSFMKICEGKVRVRVSHSNELCTSCKARKSITYANFKKENLKVIKEEERLCSVCLSVRLFPFIMGRSSYLKGDIMKNNIDVEKNVWVALFEKVEDGGRSIDDIDGSGDVIFLAIRLNTSKIRLNTSKWSEVKVNVEEIYSLNSEELKISSREFLKYISDLILEKLNNDKEDLKVEVLRYCEFGNINEDLLRNFINLIVENINRERGGVEVEIGKLIKVLVSGSCKISDNKVENRVIGILKDLLKNDLSNFNNKLNELAEKFKKELMVRKAIKSLEELIMFNGEVSIPKSLDRLFSIKQNFSIIAEYIMALLYIKNIVHVTLISPSITTPILLIIISKRDLERVFYEVLYPVFSSLLEEPRRSIPNAILTYIIKAKPYTPIHIIKEVVGMEPIAQDNSSITYIPVIVNRTTYLSQN